MYVTHSIHFQTCYRYWQDFFWDCGHGNENMCYDLFMYHLLCAVINPERTITQNITDHVVVELESGRGTVKPSTLPWTWYVPGYSDPSVHLVLSSSRCHCISCRVRAWNFTSDADVYRCDINYVLSTDILWPLKFLVKSFFLIWVCKSNLSLKLVDLLNYCQVTTTYKPRISVFSQWSSSSSSDVPMHGHHWAIMLLDCQLGFGISQTKKVSE